MQHKANLTRICRTDHGAREAVLRSQQVSGPHPHLPCAKAPAVCAAATLQGAGSGLRLRQRETRCATRRPPLSLLFPSIGELTPRPGVEPKHREIPRRGDGIEPRPEAQVNGVKHVPRSFPTLFAHQLAPGSWAALCAQACLRRWRGVLAARPQAEPGGAAARPDGAPPRCRPRTRAEVP